jgi:hypothetical protein
VQAPLWSVAATCCARVVDADPGGACRRALLAILCVHSWCSDGLVLDGVEGWETVMRAAGLGSHIPLSLLPCCGVM